MNVTHLLIAVYTHKSTTKIDFNDLIYDNGRMMGCTIHDSQGAGRINGNIISNLTPTIKLHGAYTGVLVEDYAKLLSPTGCSRGRYARCIAEI
jgi:hypothetical protein